MSGGRLSSLQRRVLKLLAGLSPPWTLSGGGALVGFHLGHRETRDLDLFWRNRGELGTITSEALGLLHAAGLKPRSIRTGPTFSQILVDDGAETCIVYLVAEPFPSIEEPVEADVDGAAIAVDSRHEILVNKLTTLLERSEIRDLADVQALLDAGGDLDAALDDAPSKDAGFSALTLAWVLKGYDPRHAASALAWTIHESPTASRNCMQSQGVLALCSSTDCRVRLRRASLCAP